MQSAALKAQKYSRYRKYHHHDDDQIHTSVLNIRSLTDHDFEREDNI